MPRQPLVFDSHALLKFFQQEKGYEKVLQLLEEVKKTGAAKYINVINLGEVIYTTKREFGDQKKLEVLANIERLTFKILSAPNPLIFQAAEYKSQFGAPSFLIYRRAAILVRSANSSMETDSSCLWVLP